MTTVPTKTYAALLSLALVLTPGLLAQTDLTKILTDTSLWGKDQGVLLAQLKAFQEAGEKTVYVFPSRIAGSTAFAQPQPAQRAVARLNASLTRARTARLKAPFAALAAPQIAAIQAQSARLDDGDGFHALVARGDTLQLLAPGLTIRAVEDKLGPPERIVLLTIQTIGDRRPAILKLHVYANGAISFAESDLAQPGLVERVLLNLSKTVPVISQ